MAREIALGEFIPKDWFKNLIEELTTVAKDEDGSTNVLASMSLVLIVLTAVLVIILPVLLCIRRSQPGSRCHGILIKVRNKILWNTVFRTSLEGYLENAIRCLFAISVLRFDSD